MRIPNKFNGYAADGIRLYHKGKGGGGSNSVEKLERERQAKVQAAVDAINNIFDPKPYTVVDPSTKVTGLGYYSGGGRLGGKISGSRLGYSGNQYDMNKTYYTADGKVFNPIAGYDYDDDGNRYARYNPIPAELYTGLQTITPEPPHQRLYDEQQQAITALNEKAVRDQYADAERANRFGLARNGLLGGSSDIESNANLQEKTNEGLIQAQALGQKAAADLRSADQQTKQNLISLAQSGIDTGTAQQMAINSLNTNAQSALGQRGGASIGNLFENLGQAYLTNQLMKAYQGGYNFQNPNYGSLSSSRGGDQGSIR